MARFVIHVGPHKTGTTYIQRCLDQNAATLRQQGILVPTEWRDSPENPSHTGLVRPIRQGRAGDLVDIFDQWRTTSDLVVISTETVFECNDQEMQRLRELLGSADYTIVYFVRRWSELMISTWSELIGQGWTMPFPEYLLNALANPESVPYINLDINLSRLARIFGKERLRLTSYNSVLDQGGDVFRHFARHYLGRPDYVPLTEIIINPSVSPSESELRRALNFIDQEGGLPRSARMTSHLKRRSVNLDITSILKGLESFTRTIVLDDTRGAVAEVLIRNRRDYADCIIPPVPQDRLYAAKKVTASFVGQEYTLAAGVVDILRALREELLR